MPTLKKHCHNSHHPVFELHCITFQKCWHKSDVPNYIVRRPNVRAINNCMTLEKAPSQLVSPGVWSPGVKVDHIWEELRADRAWQLFPTGLGYLTGHHSNDLVQATSSFCYGATSCGGGPLCHCLLPLLWWCRYLATGSLHLLPWNFAVPGSTLSIIQCWCVWKGFTPGRASMTHSFHPPHCLYICAEFKLVLALLCWKLGIQWEI